MTIQTKETAPPALQLNDLIGELKTMIDQARESIASTVNTRLAMLYWHVGSRVRKEILKDERAEYGRTIVASVARQLTLQYGKGFSEKSLRRMIQFGEVFPDQHCRITAATIELDSFYPATPYKRFYKTGLLC